MNVADHPSTSGHQARDPAVLGHHEAAGGRFAKLGAGALAGLVAALVMTVVMVLLRSTLGISPPPEMIPDRIAPLMPIPLFFWLLGTVGGYNEAKQLGVGSILAGQLVVGALFGLLYATLVERERAREPESRGLLGRPELVVALFVGLLWLVTVALVWPVLGTSYRGLPAGSAAIATALGLLLAYASSGVSLILAYRAIAGRAPSRLSGAAPRSTGRRALLVGGVGAILALTSGGLLRRLYGLATFSYDGTRLNGPDVAPVTSNDDFYVVTKNVVDPSVDRGAWRFEVTGLVGRPQSYRFEDLATLPPVTQETTLMCISNGVGDGLMSNAVWKGVPLRNLLETAGPRPGTLEVVLHGVDGYTDTIAWEKAMDPTTLVVYEMNGEPLSERHGYPVRMIVPGLVGEKNVKWITRVELVGHDVKGFYEQQGWGPNFAIPIRTRIYGPDGGEPLRMGGAPIRVNGVALGADRGVSRVEISVDDGQSWQDARLDYPGSRLSWALWSYDWRPTAPGEYRLVARATDGDGAQQIAEERGIAPETATGYHRLAVRVEA